jgi:hypothetical protein
VRVEIALSDVELTVAIDTSDGIRVGECPKQPVARPHRAIRAGRIPAALPHRPEHPQSGRYLLSVIARSGTRVIDDVLRAMPLEIRWGRAGAPDGRELQGFVRIGSTWTTPTSPGPLT